MGIRGHKRLISLQTISLSLLFFFSACTKISENGKVNPPIIPVDDGYIASLQFQDSNGLSITEVKLCQDPEIAIKSSDLNQKNGTTRNPSFSTNFTGIEVYNMNFDLIKTLSSEEVVTKNQNNLIKITIKKNWLNTESGYLVFNFGIAPNLKLKTSATYLYKVGLTVLPCSNNDEDEDILKQIILNE